MPAFDLTHFLRPERGHRRLLTQTSPGHYELCIDNTTLEKMLTCPRSFELYAVLGRDSGERDALNYGSAIHAALEVYYKGGTLNEMIAVLCVAFTAKPCAPNSWRNFDHALVAIEQYARWRDQMTMCPWVPLVLTDEEKRDDGTIQVNTRLAVEIPFKIELFKVPDIVIRYPQSLVSDVASTVDSFICQSITVFWTGKIDLLVTGRDLAPAVLDHKTSSMGGPTFWGQFRLSSQMRGYCWAGSKILRQPVRTAIIDALMGRAPTVKGKGISHENETQEFVYSDEQITEWEKDVVIHIKHVLLNLSNGYFPQANTWCFNKYGACPYFDVCALSKRAGSQLLMSGQYAERTWNPLTA